MPRASHSSVPITAWHARFSVRRYSLALFASMRLWAPVLGRQREHRVRCCEGRAEEETLWAAPSSHHSPFLPMILIEYASRKFSFDRENLVQGSAASLSEGEAHHCQVTPSRMVAQISRPCPRARRACVQMKAIHGRGVTAARLENQSRFLESVQAEKDTQGLMQFPSRRVLLAITFFLFFPF